MKTLNAESDQAQPRQGLNFGPRPAGRTAIVSSQLGPGNWRWLLAVLLWFAPALLFAQNYSIDWYKLAGGGGTSTGGTYQISGTIGQPDAGGALTGGSYSLAGGFWSLISVVQTAGLPTLTITHSGNSVLVSWPDTGSHTLQQNANLAQAGGWTTSGYTTANGTNSVTLTLPAGNLFFRLKQ